MTSSGLAGTKQVLEEALRGTDAVDLSWLAPQAERDAWTLADDTLRLVAAVVPLLRPVRVVEFGSGVSTRVLAAACGGTAEPATVVALENDPVFERRTRRELAGDESGGLACVELIRLVVRRWHDRSVPVYELPATVLDGPPPQLVLVDGPPLPLGGRMGSLLQAVHLGEAGTLVLLDDAQRPSERAALRMAEDAFGDAVEVVHLEGFAKGLAAVLVQRSVGGPAMPPAPSEGPGH